MHHEHALVRGQNICPASLQHGHVRAVLVVVLRNIVSTVTGPHDDHSRASNIEFRRIAVLAAVVERALEGLLSSEDRNASLARVSGAPHDVTRAQRALSTIVTR